MSRTPGGVARHGSRCTCRPLAGKARHVVDAAVVAAHAASLNDPARDGGDGEVAHDADDEEDDVHPVARIDGEGRIVLQFGDVVLQHQYLYSRQDGAEQVGYGQPEVHLHIAADPLRERGLKAVPHGDGEGNRTEYRQHDEEERTQGVDDERGGLEEQLHDAAEEVAYLLFEVIGTPFEVHPRHRRQVAGREAQLLYLLVERLVAHQVGGLGVARHRLILQLVFLLAVLLHVEGLLLQHPIGALDDGTHHAVKRAEHHRGEEHDAQPDDERAEHRKDVDGLGTGERLPHTVSHVEERTQTGDALRHARHVGTQRHHLLVERTEDFVKVVEVHGLPVSLVRIAVERHHAVEVVPLLGAQVAHGDVLIGVVIHEVAVVLHPHVTAVYHVHSVLVGHRERGDVHHLLEFLEHVVALFEELGVAEGDGAEFGGREVAVVQHPAVAVHVDVGNLAHHENGLAHLLGVLDKTIHRFEGVVVFLALLVNLHGLPKVLDHVLRRGRGLCDILPGVDDALRDVGGVDDRPLRACPARKEQAKGDDGKYSCFHFFVDVDVNTKCAVS